MKTFFNKNKKLILVGALAGLIIFLTSFGDDGQPPEEQNWEQDPPKVEDIMVRQLDKEGPNGENMGIEIHYAQDAIRQTSVRLFADEKNPTEFFDDGDIEKHGDEKAGDGIFSALVKEDIPGFIQQMAEFDETLRKNENMLDVFTGRVGELVKRDRPLFDRERFDKFERIELSRDIFHLRPYVDPTWATLKTEEIKDPKYDGGTSVPGNPTGREGAFIEMRKMARRIMGYGPPPPPPPPPFIDKNRSLFIISPLVVNDPARTFNPCNGTFGSGNPNGAWTFGTLMKGIAFQSVTGMTAKELTKQWVKTWMVDQTVNGDLIKNRAGKMLSMVISRWLRKAQHNAGLVVTAANWEALWNGTHQDSILRYAPLTLKAIVNRLDLRGNFGYGGGTGNAGETRFIFSVIQNTISGAPACRDSIGSGGFDGFNVIFEYGNTQTNCNAVKALGQQWVNLSTMTLGSAAYLTALENLTHLVTDSNRAPAKPNRNALNQLRTNEIALTNTTTTTGDKSPRWQFREFHINGTTKLLEPATTFNEPNGKFNGADGGLAADVTVMANWVNTNAANIIAQNTLGTVPMSIGAIAFRAGKVNYQSTSPLVAPGFWNGSGVAGNPTFINDPVARFNFSLNTCTGCHSADVQTDFTHLDYKGIGTPYSAMTATPTILVSGSQHKFDISPFLTGRGAIFTGSTFVFGDDSVSVAEDATDASLTGLYYARDAAGRTYPGTGVVRKNGVNDLQRRAQDLSNLVISNCSPFISVSIAQIAFFQPINMAH
jgi:hypothetical protein